MPEYVELTDSAAVADDAAMRTVTALRDAIAERGSATWVLAGGSSPAAAYRIIAAEHSDALDWARVSVLMGDERVVPHDHADSNWGQLSPLLTASPRVGAIHGIAPDTSLDPQSSATEYGRRIEAQLQPLRFDVVWLGVGEDGHTLSLFPGQEPVWNSPSLVTAVTDSPKPPAERITLTLAALDHAQMVLVFATGAGKRDALSRARAGEDLPIAVASARAEAAGARVAWLYDDDARDRRR
ncbi:6-phosphogluconolactonase [Microbacterium esteraromaticum]|uniref:6-phosphogluconolactonase n=1 Tax=Microbacterium esteraromaticum TaxID=57043 RepID=A0A7D7W6B2_9MICO|nr:6-phosphogluconolactonase [Microbacterium esteraromaticum]QMU95915.1 6-phosphogluconolactonase [Microbacterium esteraromaticum]